MLAGSTVWERSKCTLVDLAAVEFPGSKLERPKVTLPPRAANKRGTNAAEEVLIIVMTAFALQQSPQHVKDGCGGDGGEVVVRDGCGNVATTVTRGI